MPSTTIAVASGALSPGSATTIKTATIPSLAAHGICIRASYAARGLEHGDAAVAKTRVMGELQDPDDLERQEHAADRGGDSEEKKPSSGACLPGTILSVRSPSRDYRDYLPDAAPPRHNASWRSVFVGAGLAPAVRAIDGMDIVPLWVLVALVALVFGGYLVMKYRREGRAPAHHS